LVTKKPLGRSTVSAAAVMTAINAVAAKESQTEGDERAPDELGGPCHPRLELARAQTDLMSSLP
jgi:hypothetical protein